ncbi:MAG: hypothetical protein QME45_02755 [Clostridiales bacterium]|nr:hypothetical protein [Clostridiales bacterium]HBM81003.1 hypothetical protein [Clostridiaceae bacterium]
MNTKKTVIFSVIVILITVVSVYIMQIQYLRALDYMRNIGVHESYDDSSYTGYIFQDYNKKVNLDYANKNNDYTSSKQ